MLLCKNKWHKGESCLVNHKKMTIYKCPTRVYKHSTNHFSRKNYNEIQKLYLPLFFPLFWCEKYLAYIHNQSFTFSLMDSSKTPITKEKLTKAIQSLKGLQQELGNTNRAACDKLQEPIDELTDVEANFPLSGDVNQDILPYWQWFPNHMKAPQFGWINVAEHGESKAQQEWLQSLTDVVQILADRLDPATLNSTEQRLLKRLNSISEK